METAQLIAIFICGLVNIFKKDTLEKIQGWLFIIVLIMLNILNRL